MQAQKSSCFRRFFILNSVLRQHCLCIRYGYYVVAFWPKSKEPTLMQMLCFVSVVLVGVSGCQLSHMLTSTVFQVTLGSISVRMLLWKVAAYVGHKGFRTGPSQQFIPVTGKTCPGNPNCLTAPCDSSSFDPDLESVSLCAWRCHATLQDCTGISEALFG